MLIDYNVIRSNRANIVITVERDGDIIVNVPETLGSEEIEKQVWKKRLWIWEKLAIKKNYVDNEVSKKFISGESFLYLGRSYRLELLEEDISLKLKHGWFRLGKKQQGKAKEYFKQWYIEHLKNKIRERLEFISKKKNINAPEFRIMELGYRWGSCTKEGCLNFNWKIAMAPVSVIDYIIAHELAHLKQATHSEKFWRDVQILMPNYKASRDWLKENGHMLSL